MFFDKKISVVKGCFKICHDVILAGINFIENFALVYGFEPFIEVN